MEDMNTRCSETPTEEPGQGRKRKGREDGSTGKVPDHKVWQGWQLSPCLHLAIPAGLPDPSTLASPFQALETVNGSEFDSFI